MSNVKEGILDTYVSVLNYTGKNLGLATRWEITEDGLLYIETERAKEDDWYKCYGRYFKVDDMVGVQHYVTGLLHAMDLMIF